MLKLNARKITTMALLAGSAMLMQMAQAQAPKGIGRAEVLRHDVGEAGREAVQVRVDFAPGASVPKHSHPGEELAYVLEGTMEYQLGDQPPVTLKAGESLFIPAGVAHSAKSSGGGKAVELATYIVKKGKPILVVK
jgi:quercetin dioxygenase-like cupin family protein